MHTIVQKLTLPAAGRVLLKATAALLLLLTALSAAGGEGFQVLHTFGTNRLGIWPSGGLTPGPDGFLYGSATQGGAANRGQVFKVRPDGSDYTALKDFTGPDGLAPMGGLVLAGSWVYGTTQYGGTNEAGTVFKVRSDGGDFTILKHLRESEGACPVARLYLSGDTLYGTAYQGGIDFGGSVFKVNTDGTGFAVLKQFTGGVDGFGPCGGVVMAGNTLFGTSAGGAFSGGTLFALQADGTGYTVLKHFGSPDPVYPEGDLLLEGGVLYGTLSGGGIDDAGAVFAVNTDGSDFRVVHYFEDNEVAQPWSGVILQGSKLYGLTIGDRHGYGAVYRMETNGSGFEVLKVFSNLAIDGGYPSGFALSDTNIYGSLAYGAYGEFGALFSMNIDGTDYARFFDFSGGDGQGPVQTLLLEGETLYGITETGGRRGWGTLFKISTNGSGYELLKNFNNLWEGIHPQSGPVLLGSTLYGTAGYGGSNDCGTVFRVGTDGEGFTVVHQFDGVTAGYPKGALTLAGNSLFGATRPGWKLDGTIYKMQADGSGFEILRTFVNEGEPDGGLLISGNTIYGVACCTTTNQGMIYRINTDGGGYQVLKYFDGPDGSYPRGGLLLAGTVLYGVTEGGGSLGAGTIFRLNIDGSEFSMLHAFGFAEGSAPLAPLNPAGSSLYGIAGGGGTFGIGTIFKMEADGSGFAVLKHLQPGNPQGGLTLSGADFYGTCFYGGLSDSGILFRFSPGPPVIDGISEEHRSADYGSDFDLCFAVAGYPEPAYQWQHNGTNIPGATAARLSLTGVTGKNSGVYTLAITNSYGSVTSPPLTVSIQDPLLVAQPEGQVVRPGETATFAAVFQGSEPLFCQWFKGSGALSDDGRVSGTRSPSLVISNAAIPDEGLYRLVASNEFGVVESDAVSLTVQDPFIVLQPAHTNVAPGQAVSLTVVAGGTGPFTYQWFKNGQSLAGATESTLAFAAARAPDAGVYKAVVNHGSRRIESDDAWLTVNLALPEPFALPATTVNRLALQPDGKILVGAPFYIPGHYGLTRLNANGSVDATFRPVIKEQVRAIAVQADGRIVIGGDFPEVNGRPALRIARLNPSGTLDEGFAASCNDPVHALLIQPDGKIVLGGAFGTVNSVSRSCVARLNSNGTLDEAFAAAASSLVTCLALQSDGKIVIGGNFSHINGNPRRMIARLNSNGSLDTDFEVIPNPEFSASATALALQPDGKIVVGGRWSVTSGQGSINRLARVSPNGSWDEGFIASVNQDVSGLALQPDAKVLVAGFFTALSEAPISYLGRLMPDGRLDPTFNPAPNSTVLALLHQQIEAGSPPSPQPQCKLLVGGQFNAIGGQARAGIARLALLECPQPMIAPAAQTVETGAIAALSVRDKGYPTPSYQWTLGGVALSGQTNPVLHVAAGPECTGLYTVTASNAADCVTSAPAALSIIPPVNRRFVPAISAPNLHLFPMHVEFNGDPGQANWTLLEPFILGEPPQVYLDLAAPAPARRFYRAWRDFSRPPAILGLRLVPELTITGTPGDSIRIDWITPIGPTNAWNPLATITLTNSTQQYYDLTYGGDARLYRLAPSTQGWSN